MNSACLACISGGSFKKANLSELAMDYILSPKATSPSNKVFKKLPPKFRLRLYVFCRLYDSMILQLRIHLRSGLRYRARHVTRELERHAPARLDLRRRYTRLASSITRSTASQLKCTRRPKRSRTAFITKGRSALMSRSKLFATLGARER